MTGRDRLRELLDAVLDEEHRSLADMAHGAYSSPFHFSRRLVRDAGEPPVAMRRRVALERAAWQLARGAPVTDAAFAAGYGSVEGFARAFARAYGHPPSATPDRVGRRLGALAARTERHPLPRAGRTVGRGFGRGVGGRGHRADGAPRRRRRAHAGGAGQGPRPGRVRP